MRYHEEIAIDRSLGEVTALFADPDNLAKWQPELLGVEPVEGVPGTPGAKRRLRYDFSGRKVQMTETVLDVTRAGVFDAVYEADGVWNLVRNRFAEVDGRTVWTMTSEFRFTSFAMKAISVVAPGMFKSQSKKMMANFKAFAETGSLTSAAD
jgi:hypothetical protein